MKPVRNFIYGMTDYQERHQLISEYLDEIDEAFKKAVFQVASAADRIYVDGVSVFDLFIRHHLLNDLGKYMEVGLCHEAAVIAMFCLKDNPTARLMTGRAECDPFGGRRCDHAWVEFFVDGVSFTIDPTWYYGTACLPSLIHVDQVKSLVVNSLSYQEFWGLEFSRLLYALAHTKKTSYVLPWMFFYRSQEGEYDFPLLENGEAVTRLGHVEPLSYATFCPTGEKDQFHLFFDKITRGGDFLELKNVI